MNTARWHGDYGRGVDDDDLGHSFHGERCGYCEVNQFDEGAELPCKGPVIARARENSLLRAQVRAAASGIPVSAAAAVEPEFGLNAALAKIAELQSEVEPLKELFLRSSDDAQHFMEQRDAAWKVLQEIRSVVFNAQTNSLVDRKDVLLHLAHLLNQPYSSVPRPGATTKGKS